MYLRSFAELIFAGFGASSVNLANISLIAWALPPDTLLAWQQGFKRLLGQPEAAVEAQPGRLDRLALWLATIWVGAASAFLSVFVYESRYISLTRWSIYTTPAFWQMGR